MDNPAIPRTEFTERQRAVRERLAGEGLAALLVVGRSFYDRCGDLAYLSNHFPPFPASVFSESSRGLGHALLVVPATGDPTLVADGRAHRADLVAVDDVRSGNDLAATTAAVLQERGLAEQRVGLAGSDIVPLRLYQDLRAACPRLDLVEANGIVAGLRQRKSPAERALLRRAAEIAGVGLEAAVAALRAGASEQEVCAAGTAAALAAGADFVRYLRVHSGPWSGWSSRWPPATERRLVAGDAVTLDIIGAFRGYGFDVLRSTAVGPPSPQHRRVLEAALAATEAAVAACRAGVPVAEVVRAALVPLERAGLVQYAPAFMGHGIGLETVEEPFLVASNQARLEEGMVLCVEPSLRLPDALGASIEQEIVVRDGPPELLTTYPARLW